MLPPKALGKALGLNYEPEGLLLDIDLRPHVPVMEVLTFDAMHIILSNGMADHECADLFTSLQGVCTWDDMRKFMQANFRFNRHPHSKCLTSILSAHRENRFRRDGAFSQAPARR